MAVHSAVGDSRRQTDLETMRCDCKAKFCNKQAGVCKVYGKNIQYDMAQHMSNYHLDLDSCGCARFRGEPSGRYRRIASITFVHDTT